MNVEFYSAYAYLSMSAYCRLLSMNGFAHWLETQAREELLHATKMYNYLNDQGAPVTLLPIDQPPTRFQSLVEVFEKALAHERHVTALLNDLTGFALQEKDHATHTFLQWYITEQVEEEATVNDILQSLKLVKDSGQGQLMLDRELAARTPEVNSSAT